MSLENLENVEYETRTVQQWVKVGKDFSPYMDYFTTGIGAVLSDAFDEEDRINLLVNMLQTAFRCGTGTITMDELKEAAEKTNKRLDELALQEVAMINAEPLEG